MEQYIRAYIYYLQEDCATWLPLDESDSNNTELEITKITPFLANQAFYPRIGFEPVEPSPSNIRKIIADLFASLIEEIQ